MGYIIYKYYKTFSSKDLESMPEEEFLNLLLGVSIALLDIHSKGYVHKDVYFSNIGQDTDGKYILIDTETLSPVKKTLPNTNSEFFNDVEIFFSNLNQELKRGPNYKIHRDVFELIKKESDCKEIEKERKSLFSSRIIKTKFLLCTNYIINIFFDVINLYIEQKGSDNGGGVAVKGKKKN